MVRSLLLFFLTLPPPAADRKRVLEFLVARRIDIISDAILISLSNWFFFSCRERNDPFDRRKGGGFHFFLFFFCFVFDFQFLDVGRLPPPASASAGSGGGGGGGVVMSCAEIAIDVEPSRKCVSRSRSREREREREREKWNRSSQRPSINLGKTR